MRLPTERSVMKFVLIAVGLLVAVVIFAGQSQAAAWLR